MKHTLTGFEMQTSHAKFTIGEVVRHRVHSFRGVIFDVDPVFSNTEEWYNAIPAENRPSRDQPFYHLLAENETSYYVAYVSEQNLVRDETGEPPGRGLGPRAAAVAAAAATSAARWAAEHQQPAGPSWRCP